jgi:hypothetical protein
MTRHEIELGGKRRPIRFGFGALMLFEESTGANISEFFAKMASGDFKIRLLIELIYAGLKNGARANNEQFDADVMTIADWVDEAQAEGRDVLTEVVKYVEGSMATDQGSKKKA